MEVSRFMKMLCFHACVFALFVASVKAEESGSPPEEEKKGDQKYIVHGWLMWSAFGLLFPSGILAAKYGQKTFASWFWFHKIAQVLGVICGTIGMIMAFTAGEGDEEGGEEEEGEDDSKIHVKLGLAVAIAMWAVVVLGFIRPNKGTALRPYWYFGHWLLGTASIALAWYNILEGLELVHAKEVLHTLFGVQISLFTFAYLFLGQWDHLLSQNSLVRIEDTSQDPKKMTYV